MFNLKFFHPTFNAMYSLENKQKPWQVTYSKYWFLFPEKWFLLALKFNIYTCLLLFEDYRRKQKREKYYFGKNSLYLEF